MGQRIKGQETNVMLIVAGKLQDTITDVRSFEVTSQLEILKEGYLGETTDRRDDIYRGVKFRMELHIENQDILRLFRQLIDRARRRVPGTQVNVKTTLQFPNGDRPIILVEDAYFGEIPLNFASRSDYGAVSLEGEAQDYSVLA